MFFLFSFTLVFGIFVFSLSSYRPFILCVAFVCTIDLFFITIVSLYLTIICIRYIRQFLLCSDHPISPCLTFVLVLLLYFCFASGTDVHSTIYSEMNTRLWINYLKVSARGYHLSGSQCVGTDMLY